MPKENIFGYSNIYKADKNIRVAIVPCGYMDGFNVKADKDMHRLIDKLRYVKQALIVKQLYTKINNQRCEILGKVGMYHIVANIDGQEVKINDEVIFDVNPLYVDSGIERRYV
ncbi:alanine racemase [compost metagenome]